MLLGLIMKFLLLAITITPTCMTIIPSGSNLIVEFKTFGRILIHLITQQSDRLWRRGQCDRNRSYATRESSTNNVI